MLIGITSPFVEGLLFVTTCRQAAFTFAALIMGIASWKVVPVGYKDKRLPLGTLIVVSAGPLSAEESDAEKALEEEHNAALKEWESERQDEAYDRAVEERGGYG